MFILEPCQHDDLSSHWLGLFDCNQNWWNLISLLFVQLNPVSHCLFSFQFHEYIAWPGHESGEDGRTGRGNREVYRKNRSCEAKNGSGKEFSERVYSTLDQGYFLATTIIFVWFQFSPNDHNPIQGSYVSSYMILFPALRTGWQGLKWALAWCMMKSK